MPTSTNLKYSNTGNRYVHESSDQKTYPIAADTLRFLRDQLDTTTDPAEKSRLQTAIRKEEERKERSYVGVSDPRSESGLSTKRRGGEKIDRELELEDKE